MCFSATSSFIAAAVTGAAGIAALTKVDRPQDVMLAATPLFFAVQQSIEGMLWLNLPASPGNQAVTPLTVAFLLFAKVFWPIHSPLAALLSEPEPSRRSLISWCLVIGVAVSGYFLWSIWSYPQAAVIIDGRHIAYVGSPQTPIALGFGYIVATTLAPVLSSHAAVRLFAAIVLASAVTTYFLFWDAFSSVWCFFAAGASAIIVLHFARQRQLRTAALSS
jgi:hypothetical protein